MSTTYSEDHPDRKVTETVDATPVEGLDREPAAIKAKTVEAKVVEAPAEKPAKKASAKPTTKAKG